MADKQEKEYIKNLKHNAFMGTIAVCVVYAIIALLLIVYVNITEQGKALYDDLKPFALTFIFGTLFIIIATTILVLNWEPEQAKKATVNDVLNNQFSCPDYYKLEETNIEMTDLMKYTKDIEDNTWINNSSNVDLHDYMINENNSNLVKHKCVYDQNIFGDNNIEAAKFTDFPHGGTAFGSSDTVTTNTSQNDYKALGAFTAMYGGYGKSLNCSDSSTTKFNYDKAYCLDSLEKSANTDIYDCTKVYPEYLAYLDAQEYVNNNEQGPKNLHRCEWSKKCKVPWTSAGCG